MLVEKGASTHKEEIVLAGTANFDNLRRHSDEECRTYQSSTAVPFLQRNCVPKTHSCSDAGGVRFMLAIFAMDAIESVVWKLI